MNLKKLRKKFNMKQKDLALKLGVSNQAISMYEKQNREPSIGLLKEMARIFDTSIDYIVSDIEEEFSYPKTMMQVDEGERFLVSLLRGNKRFFDFCCMFKDLPSSQQQFALNLLEVIDIEAKRPSTKESKKESAMAKPLINADDDTDELTKNILKVETSHLNDDDDSNNDTVEWVTKASGVGDNDIKNFANYIEEKEKNMNMLLKKEYTNENTINNEHVPLMAKPRNYFEYEEHTIEELEKRIQEKKEEMERKNLKQVRMRNSRMHQTRSNPNSSLILSKPVDLDFSKIDMEEDLSKDFEEYLKNKHSSKSDDIETDSDD